MCIYRRKLKPILQKRAARFYCSLPPRRSVCSTNRVLRRLGFFTSPVENGRATKQAGIALIKWSTFHNCGRCARTNVELFFRSPAGGTVAAFDFTERRHV